MRILLDCRPLQAAGPDAERSRLIFFAAAALSASEGFEWVLVTDHHYRRGLFPALPGRVVIRRVLPGRAGWRWWYDRQLPRVAKQQGVDRVWLTGGIAGEMGVPVCLWMPERVTPVDGGGGRGAGTLFRNRLRQSLERAAAVVCYSERDRLWLDGLGPVGKVKMLTAVADESIGMMPAAEKEKIKAERLEGREYFLADLTGCGEEDVVNLLKAFSLFKKRQRSGMRLVLAGGPGLVDGVAGRLKTYKYRQDVDWTGAVPAGAAYAVLFPVEGNSLGKALLNVWKAGVPVIAAAGGIMEEMAQGAVLTAVSGDPAALAAQLMRIYKEEDLRQRLIGKGFERLKVYSRENFLQVLRVITEIGPG
ncbi:MAG TPA: glycosyltransferase [Puia sp.]|nr:glycosyltransferase [Puia sp.]